MKTETEAQKANSVDEKGPTPTPSSVETKASSTSKDASTKAAPQSKRIRYTKQEMMALAKERVSLQRPPNLLQEPIFRRYRENNANKEKPVVEKERSEVKEAVPQKTERPPKEQPKQEAPKPRKDRYGTPSWFTEEINSSEAFQFGTLDREADKAQMAKSLGKPIEPAKSESEGEDEDQDLAHEEVSEPEPVSMKLPTSQPRSQTPEPQPPPEPELLPLERLGIRDPSRETSREASQSQGKEHGPWNNTWPSLFGSFFPGFTNEPPRHDPWSAPIEVPPPKPVTPTVSAINAAPPPLPSSASDQTAALKSMLRIGGLSLGAKPLETHHSQSASQEEWTSGAPTPASGGWPRQPAEVLPKITPSNWPQERERDTNNRGWTDPVARDAEWREGITGWQQHEAGWPEPPQTKPVVRAEWQSRDPRSAPVSHHHTHYDDGEDAVFKGDYGSSASLSAYSANAATVAKRSNLSVQALLSMNIPNRNPMPHNAVLVSTLENRQLVRAAAERERSLDKGSRPTVSFTSPAEAFPRSQDPMADHIARMVSKAHQRKNMAPAVNGNAPSVTFSNRSPPMRYSQNQFATSSSSSRQTGYADPQQQPLQSPQQMFYQQNSHYSSMLPSSSQQGGLAAATVTTSQSFPRATFTGGAQVSGTPLEKWFGHMLPKPNGSHTN